MNTEHRTVVYWNVEVLIDSAGNKISIHGHTHDISLQGATITTDQYVSCKSPILLKIKVPRGKSIKDWLEINIHCKSAIAVAEGDHFTIPLTFVKFDGEGERLLILAIQDRGGVLTTASKN